MKKGIKTLSVLGLQGAIAALSAEANSITLSETAAAGTGPSTWTYAATFINSTVRPGDFVTINDFGPATVFVSLPPGWAFSQSFTGPDSVAVSDSPARLNATWTWTGAATMMSPNPATAVTLSFVLSSPGAVSSTLALYTTKDHVTSGVVVGTESDVVGFTSIPTDPPRIPDPGSTAGLLGCALGGLEVLRRRIRADVPTGRTM